jgi:hypothetical protein
MKVTVETSEGTQVKEYSAEDEKVLVNDIYEIAEWVFNAVNEKCRRHGDRIVEQHTAYNPKKLSKAEKDLIIKDITLETAKERTDKLE